MSELANLSLNNLIALFVPHPFAAASKYISITYNHAHLQLLGLETSDSISTTRSGNLSWCTNHVLLKTSIISTSQTGLISRMSDLLHTLLSEYCNRVGFVWPLYANKWWQHISSFAIIEWFELLVHTRRIILDRHPNRYNCAKGKY